MGLFKTLGDAMRSVQSVSAPEPKPEPKPAPRREPTQEEIERRIHLLNECVVLEGFVKHSDEINALPGEWVEAVAKKGDEGYLFYVDGKLLGWIWARKCKGLGLRDGLRVLLEVEHSDRPNDYAQLFLPIER